VLNIYEIAYVLFLLQTTWKHILHIRINMRSAWNYIPAMWIRGTCNNF